MNFVSANELNIEKEVLTIWFIKSYLLPMKLIFSASSNLQIGGFDALWWNTASERATIKEIAVRMGLNPEVSKRILKKIENLQKQLFQQML
jgi:hypothetical protein